MYTRSLSSRFQACQENDVSLAGHCFLLALHFVEKNAGVMMLTYKSLVREVSYIYIYMLKRHQILYHLKSVAIQLCWDKASNLVDMHPSRPQSHVHRNFSRDEHLG